MNISWEYSQGLHFGRLIIQIINNQIMKNLLFILILTIGFGLMSFTSLSEANNVISNSESSEVIEYLENEAGCWHRSCFIDANGVKWCTEWEWLDPCPWGGGSNEQ